MLSVKPKKTKTTILPRQGGGGGGKSEAEKQADAYKNLIERAQERIEQMKVEGETLGMTEGAAAAYRLETELLGDAARADIPLTEARRAEIKKLAADMSEATVATEELKEAQKRLNETMEAAKSDVVDVAKGLRDAFADGRVEAEELLDVVNNLIGKLSDRAFDSIGDALFSTTGPLAGIFGSFLGAPGRASGGSVSAGRPYMVGEHGRELFMPSTAGRIVPAGKMSGQSVDARMTYHIDARGAQLGVGEEIRRAITTNNAQRDRSLTTRLAEQQRR